MNTVTQATIAESYKDLQHPQLGDNSDKRSRGAQRNTQDLENMHMQ